MESSFIYVYIDDKIETWHTVFYLGRIPIFYFPYYTQSLKSNKLPFEFKVGHNQATGFYVLTRYNHFFDYYNDASIGWEYYELRGNKYTFDFNYGILRYPDKNGRILTGTFSGFYNQDKSTHIDRWQIDTNHSQTINERTRANERISIFSDMDLRKDNLAPNMDMLRQEYSANFSTGFGNHYFSISAADYEQLNTTTSKYYTYSRTLPSLSYDIMSTQIIPFFYYRNSANLSRTYNVAEDYYYKTANISPGISFNLPRFYIFTFNTGVNFNGSWTHIDNFGTNGDISRIDQPHGGNWLVSYSNNELLQIDLVPPGYLKLTLNHTFSRQLNKRELMKYEGITSNQINGNLYANLGPFVFNANTSYDLLKTRDEVINDRDRFSLLNMSASLNLSGNYFSAQSSYSIFANMIKSLNMNYSMSDGINGQWSVAAGTTFVNNLIDTSGHFVDYTVKDVIYFNTSISYAFTKEFRVSMSRWYDLIEKDLKEHSYSINWFLHCWEAYITWTKRQDNVEEIFFSIFISALPQYKFNKPSTATPSYNLQFGQ